MAGAGFGDPSRRGRDDRADRPPRPPSRPRPARHGSLASTADTPQRFAQGNSSGTRYCVTTWDPPAETDQLLGRRRQCEGPNWRARSSSPAACRFTAVSPARRFCIHLSGSLLLGVIDGSLTFTSPASAHLPPSDGIRDRFGFSSEAPHAAVAPTRARVGTGHRTPARATSSASPPTSSSTRHLHMRPLIAPLRKSPPVGDLQTLQSRLSPTGQALSRSRARVTRVREKDAG